MTDRDPKVCVVCGREIEWRRKWARDWSGVKYCSKSCRARRGDPVDGALERAMLELLRARRAGASICPSEAARALDPSGWRGLMAPARMAARRLTAAGVAEVTQRGRVVDARTCRGPIRVRLAGRAPAQPRRREDG